MADPVLCACGCGALTVLYRGVARRYVHGHNTAPRVIRPDDYTIEDCGFITSCWIWQGKRGTRGRVTLRGRKTWAYRAMYEQAHGSVPDGLELDHLCREPACIRPDHLEAVTHAENIRRGSTSVLTHALAEEIKAARAATGESHRKLAHRFGVGKTTIGAVLAGTSWTP